MDFSQGFALKLERNINFHHQIKSLYHVHHALICMILLKFQIPLNFNFSSSYPFDEDISSQFKSMVMEGIGPNNNSCTTRPHNEGGGGNNNNNLEKKARPQEQLNCPRCNSTNTKFCYYNNYSLTQPRYFCKTCRRYWTEGGSLRNVPVGGGSRKNKIKINTNNNSSSSSSTTSTPSSNSKVLVHQDLLNPNNNRVIQGQDLNLAFPSMDHHNNYHHGLLPFIDMANNNNNNNNNNSNGDAPSSLSALELLRSSMASRGLSNPYYASSNSSLVPSNSSSVIYPTSGLGFPTMQEVVNNNKQNSGNLGFSSSSSIMDHQHHEENIVNNSDGGGRVLFPFGEVMKSAEENNNKEQGNNSSSTANGGYWNGMMGQGSW
ncbi:hypothetical protein Ahy_A08g041145 [Arachis hypogaea]|uniref:Dof zinc finger protein n=2 Tax=Arachis hypogaea TaxID=3818 RepID=A0A445C1S2_ARAHY|nr:hypothetical protein Ahy_A08g041145 [Arachis hypogaea]